MWKCVGRCIQTNHLLVWCHIVLIITVNIFMSHDSHIVDRTFGWEGRRVLRDL